MTKPIGAHAHRVEFIAIGGSLGGLQSVVDILSVVPSDFDVPIAIVLHRQATSDGFLAESLQNQCGKVVREATDKAKISSRTVVIAPADYHLLIDCEHYALNVDSPINHARPSIDVTFESVAENFGPSALAILLTGGGSDGADGLKSILEHGGQICVESPITAEAAEMPSTGIKATKTPCIYSSEQLGAEILKRCDEGVQTDAHEHIRPFDKKVIT